jgi:hypothetical protein
MTRNAHGQRALIRLFAERSREGACQSCLPRVESTMDEKSEEKAEGKAEGKSGDDSQDGPNEKSEAKSDGAANKQADPTRLSRPPQASLCVDSWDCAHAWCPDESKQDQGTTLFSCSAR